MENNKKKLVTHNGSFHADDVFATATLSLLLEGRGEKFEITRTRDMSIIEQGDYVYDVGGVYDPETNRFDHHQKGGAGARENGIEYSSFGLIWKHFGLELCEGDEEAWKTIDNEVACPVDALDNGQDVVTPKFSRIMPYNVGRSFTIFAPSWEESVEKIDEVFFNQIPKAKELLKREIEVAKSNSSGRKILKQIYDRTEDKRIIEFSEPFPRYLYQDLLSQLPEPLFAVHKSNHSENWKVEAISKNPDTLVKRKLFPESWRGLREFDPKLKELTEIDGFIFCHRGGFLSVLTTREGALKLAQLALSAKS